MRVADIVGRVAYGLDGRRLGRIADLVIHHPDSENPVVDAILVTRRRRGRLLGYEREGMSGPWPIEKLARRLYRGGRVVPWDQFSLHNGSEGERTDADGRS